MPKNSNVISVNLEGPAAQREYMTENSQFWSTVRVLCVPRDRGAYTPVIEVNPPEWL